MMEGIETFGKYRLLDRVAIGGMAEIFKASTTGVGGFERVVAIKRLHRHLSEDEELAQMLVDEARITVQLQHANIAQVFDLGMLGGQYFIVMEFIDGMDLFGVLRHMREQSRTMPVPLALYAVSKMLGALDYAHNSLGPDRRPLNIIHRDVSPQNLMVTLRGEIKLVDFGIAKARMRLMETQAGIIKGKFYYMAPEQAHGHHLDRRTDVFASGMVLYELLTNRPAYEEGNDLALLKRVRVCDFPPPSSIRRDIDPHLEAIIMKALARDPNQRFSTARDFQSALHDYLQRRFGSITEHHMAEFVQGLANPAMEKTNPIQNAMRHGEYQTSEHSVIFDASAYAIPEQDGFYEENTIIAPSGPNPFAANNEATHVFMREEDNPFAIPDEFEQEATSTKDVHWQHPVDNKPVRNPTPPKRNVHVQPMRKPNQHQPMMSAPSPFAQRKSPDDTAETLQQVHSVSGVQSGFAPRATRPPGKESTQRTAALVDKIKSDKRYLAGIIILLFLVFGLALILGLNNNEKTTVQPKQPIAKNDVSTKKVATVPKLVSLPVNTKPGNANVYIDGVLVGRTPLAIPSLEVGKTVSMKVTKDKFVDWEQRILVVESPKTFEVVLKEDKKRDGIIKIVTNPPAVRIEINAKYVGKSPVEESNFDRAKVHTIVAILDDGTMKREKVVWDENDGKVKRVELVFVDKNAQAKRGLPGPPEADEPVKKTYTRPKRSTRRYRPRRSKPDKNPKNVNIWGEKKKKKASPKKDDDDGGNVNVWGG